MTGIYNRLISFYRENKRKWYFPVVGLLAMSWFLIRVIPKPSRATYPCQRAAFPLATAFIIYLAAILGSAGFIRRAIRFIRETRYVYAFFSLLVVGLISVIVLSVNSPDLSSKVLAEAAFVSNQPVGVPDGEMSGRVVWVWNPDAVDESCPNTWREDKNWYMPEYTNLATVQDMLTKGLEGLTGQSGIFDSWDYLFRYSNQARERGTEGYKAGEKIAVKLNFVTCDNSNMDGHNKDENLNMIDTSPQVYWSVINHLVNVMGVAQSDISIGDPGSYFPDQYYNMIAPDFPDVVYLSLEDGATGRTKILSTDNQVVFFSDGSGGDYLPVHFVEADYMINISVVKHHGAAGFSNIAKNHFGSNMRNSAEHMHSSLVSNQPGLNHYRHFVDLLAHKDLGGKTILNIGDMLWSSANAWSGPVRFRQTPFNDDYPSSLLISYDPVANEAVALDFISSETWGDNLATADGVNDFLIQAADPSIRPEGISYDPENDGSIVDYSLGIYEHWNNVGEKLYTKNLGTADGIELVKIFLNGSVPDPYTPANFALAFENADDYYIHLSWTDINPDEDGYIIEKSTDGGNTYSEIAATGPDVTSYNDYDVEGKGVYYYRIKTYRGIQSSEFVSASIRFDATSIGNNSQAGENISLYPVPAADYLVVDRETSFIYPLSVRIYDLNGKLLLTRNFKDHGAGGLRMNTSELKNGMYLLDITAGDDQKVRRNFIIQK